jgi:hypothetical protein
MKLAASCWAVLAQLNFTRQWSGRSISFLGTSLMSLGGALAGIAIVVALVIMYCKCCRGKGAVPGAAPGGGTTSIIQAAPAPAPILAQAATLPVEVPQHEQGVGWDPRSWGGQRGCRSYGTDRKGSVYGY